MFPKLEAVLSSKFVYSSGSDNPRARSTTATNPELLISTKTDDVTTITYTSKTSRNYLFSFSVNGARDSRKLFVEKGKGKICLHFLEQNIPEPIDDESQNSEQRRLI